MRFFYFLAKKICYTFAIAFLTIIGSWVFSVFGFFLGMSFVIISYEKLSLFFSVWLPIGVAIPVVMHYVEFGMLTPLKIPAFIEPLRIVNTAYRNNLEVPDEDLTRVYTAFTDLPMYNLIVGTIHVLIGGAIVLLLSVYQFYYRGTFSAVELRAVIKVSTLTIMIILILYGMATYLLTEALTNAERSRLYNKIVQTGARVKPRALIGIRLKFLFFVWLMVITLLTFAALMEKVRFLEEYNIAVLAVYFGMSILASFLLMQITTGLHHANPERPDPGHPGHRLGRQRRVRGAFPRAGVHRHRVSP